MARGPGAFGKGGRELERVHIRLCSPPRHCCGIGRAKRPRLLPGLRPSNLWVGRDLAKQAVAVLIRPRGEEQLVGLAAIAALAPLDGPDLIADDVLPLCILPRPPATARS